MDLVHELDARTRGLASSGPAVVVVQSTHDRQSDPPCCLHPERKEPICAVQGSVAECLDVVVRG